MWGPDPRSELVDWGVQVVLTGAEMVLASRDSCKVWRGHLPHGCIIPF